MALPESGGQPDNSYGGKTQMATKTHTYVCKKGYAPEYKGREVRWQYWTTPEEAIQNGAFDSIETIMRYANAQLNIKKGHAVQAATVEKVKDADGKPTDKLANPSMTQSAMEALAAGVSAKATERTRGSGGGKQKDRAKAFDTAKDKAKAMAETATPDQLAALLSLGFITQEEHDAKLAAARNGGAAPAKARAK